HGLSLLYVGCIQYETRRCQGSSCSARMLRGSRSARACRCSARRWLPSLTLALRAARPIQFPTNIELVQKYYDKIDVTTISAYDGDSWRNSSVAHIISE